MDLYWFQDINGILLNINYLDEIFPSPSMSYPRKVNAFVRLSIYMGIIISIIFMDVRFLFLPIGVMILTYIMYLLRKQSMKRVEIISGNDELGKIIKQNNSININKNINKNIDNFSNYLDVSIGAVPSVNNPFMNALPFDPRDRAAAPYVNTDHIKSIVESKYNKYLMKDASDVFNHNNGRRQFYTNPNTTYPNKQTEFAMWLYGTPPTCKEGNGAQCVANNFTGLGLYGNSELNFNM